MVGVQEISKLIAFSIFIQFYYDFPPCSDGLERGWELAGQLEASWTTRPVQLVTAPCRQVRPTLCQLGPARSPATLRAP